MSVFAFDKGEGLSEHAAPFGSAVYLLEGEAEIRIDGKPHSVKEGGMVIMPANKPHALTDVTSYKMLLVMIKHNKSIRRHVVYEGYPTVERRT